MKKAISLRVPYFPQPSGVGWCVPACLRMVMAYHGEHLSIEEIAEEMGVTKHGGIDEMHAAMFLLRRGYGVRVLGWHHGYPASFSKFRGALPEDTFLEWAFREVKHPSMFRMACRNYGHEFLKRGGIIEPRPTSLEDIRESLEQREPAIVIVNVTTLWHSESTGTHAIVAIGLSDFSVTFLDPSIAGGKTGYPHTVFLHAFYRVEGSALLITPPKQ